MRPKLIKEMKKIESFICNLKSKEIEITMEILFKKCYYENNKKELLEYLRFNNQN
jgi:hypothetical protein